MKRQIKQSGFGTIEILLVILVVLVIAIVGLVVYRQYHKQSNPKNNALTSQVQQTQQQESTTTTQTQTNVYANWKTYCDSVYHYCFKYPHDWAFLASSASKPGDNSGVSILNPAKTIQITYGIPDTHDSSLLGFNTISLDTFTVANQSLTIVGGYIPTSGDNGIAGNNVPGYRIIDTSLLNVYPLTVGTVSEFPSNPDFTVKSTSYQGAFVIKPAVTMNSLADTRAWFSNSDVKASLLVLKSFYYQQTL